MITVLHGGESLGTTKSDYVICAGPHISSSTCQPDNLVVLSFYSDNADTSIKIHTTFM